MTLYQDIVDIKNKYTDSVARFNAVKQYLAAHRLNPLWLEMTAPGIGTYDEAKQWFTDYYVLDRNEGPLVAANIASEISQADPKKYYRVEGDYDFGYDSTPDEFEPVSDAELDTAVDELIKKLHDPDYKMYTA